ncbi:MAG: N,N-dimethylformamidase beta subunit family domain-containing protein [Acidimicrobiales bacterium]
MVIGGIAAAAAAAAGFGLDELLTGSRTHHQAGTPPVHGTPLVANASAGSADIVAENKLPGTEDWRILQSNAVWDKIRGFASRTSVNAGEPFDLYVTTNAATWSATAYRMGFYGGKGGREVWRSPQLKGTVQPGPRTDPATNMRDAPWTKSLTVEPATWPPGSYLFKLTSDDGGQSQIPIVIRNDTHLAPVHIQHDVTTWQAYNQWGGASLYEGAKGRSTWVSFDRPYDLSGSGNFLGGVHEITALVESLGLDVTYSTSLDTHAQPALVAKHKVWISPAHDEYWSLEMRNGVQAARDAGVNLMFLGANCMFRRIRLQDSPIGPNRHQINYRIASLDPLNGKDPARVTTSWRDPPDPMPESEILGNFYESNPVKGDMVISAPDAWMFAGTGVHQGTVWPGVIGNEYDRVTLEVTTPANIQVLAHSPVVCRGQHRYADMTYYTAASGAGVFDAGSIWFERHLVPGQGGAVDATIQKMVTNMLQAFSGGPVGAMHPSVSNLTQLGIHKGYLPPLTGSAPSTR